MIDVSVTRSPGQTIYAFPDRSEGFSLADWTTHRVLLTEGTAPDTGIYTGQLDETKAYLWRFFEGASQPTDWDKDKGFFDLTQSVIERRTDVGVLVALQGVVAEDGSLSEIIVGDDYLDANGRAFKWTVAAVDGININDADCYFGGQATIDGVDYSWLVQGTVTHNSPTWTLTFDLPRATTANLAPGRYRWSVEVRGPTGTEITRVKNASNCLVRLVEKQT